MHEINGGTSLHDLVGNIIFHAGPAQNGGNVWILLLQRAGHGHAGQQLLEDNAEADQSKTAPVSAVHTEINELRSGFIAQAHQIVESAMSVLADAAKDIFV